MLLLKGGGAREGVRSGGGCRSGGPRTKSGRARRRVLAAVSVNLDVQKQLVLLDAPEGNKSQCNLKFRIYYLYHNI